MEVKRCVGPQFNRMNYLPAGNGSGTSLIRVSIHSFSDSATASEEVQVPRVDHRVSPAQQHRLVVV